MEILVPKNDFSLNASKLKNLTKFDYGVVRKMFINCIQFDAQIAGNCISKLPVPDFKVFWGIMSPDPPS